MGYRKKEAPGFMVYFDLIPAFNRMTKAQVGEFVLSMAEYALNGIQPYFADDRQEMLWDIVAPRIDANKGQYFEKVLRTSYAGWCSSLKNEDKTFLKVDFEDWVDAKKRHAEFCNSLPRGQPAPSFNDWITQGKTVAIEGKTVAIGSNCEENDDGSTLPWTDAPYSY